MKPERERAVEDVRGDDRLGVAIVAQVGELERRGEAGDRLARRICVGVSGDVAPKLDSELGVGVQVGAAAPVNRSWVEPRRRGQVADDVVAADALPLADAELPSHTTGAAAKRGPPLAKLDGQ